MNKSLQIAAICLAILFIPVFKAISAVGRSSSPDGGPEMILFHAADPGPSLNLADEEALITSMYSDRQIHLATDAEFETPAGVVTRYRQEYNGIPVIGGSLIARYNLKHELTTIYSTVTELTGVENIVFRLGITEAVDEAIKAINVMEMRGNIDSDPVILPRNGVALPCWQVTIPASDPLGDWFVYIDASNGEVVLIEDRLQRLQGRGLVFDPDPVSTLEDTTLRDRDDSRDAIDENAYQQVVLHDIGLDDDNRYVLSGRWIDTTPTGNRSIMEEPEFFFDREDDRFEEVMAYYHLDRQARYIASLGFGDLPPDSLAVNVNGIDADVSFFSPLTGILTTGTGGIDDAEDADVLIHEYSHAIMHEIIPNWRGGETALLTEGSCDYFAGDRSLESAPEFQPYKLYNWDGNGEFWNGRILNADYHYPEDTVRERHDAGQLWSSFLTEVRQNSGSRDEWNRVIIDHLFTLGDSVTVPDAVAALIESDMALNNGLLRNHIVQSCISRGILPTGLYSPEIAHIPLRDTEDLNSEHIVTAQVTSEIGLDEQAMWLIYRYNDEELDTLTLELIDEEENLYSSVIPAPESEADLQYYLVVVDTLGVFSTHPVSAPFTLHSLHVGPDRIDPVITGVDSISDSVFPEGEIFFGTHIEDNISVAEGTLIWYWDDMNPGGMVSLTRSEEDSSLFTGRFHWALAGEGIIRYMVTAVDASEAGNTSSSRVKSFTVRSDAPVDYFEDTSRRWIIDGWQRDSLYHAQGRWSLSDRSPEGFNTPRIASAELNESWDLSRFESARLHFTELHRFDEDAEETGYVEVSSDEGETWEQILELRGSEIWWMHRRMDLSDYCIDRSDPIRVRFRTVSPEGTGAGGGWWIDALHLYVGDIVSTDYYDAEPAEFFTLAEPFPNPSNGRFSFHYSLPFNGKISLLDQTGRLLVEKRLTPGAGITTVNADGLSSGLYMLRLETNGRTQMRKIILIK